jgi:hypothetical protein
MNEDAFNGHDKTDQVAFRVAYLVAGFLQKILLNCYPNSSYF